MKPDGIVDWNGEWIAWEEEHTKLPEADPYWFIAQIGLVIVSWGCVALAILAAVSRG